MIARVVPITRIRRDTSFWSYQIPHNQSCHPGSLVVIPFRDRSILGVVWEIAQTDEKATEIISEIIFPKPLLKEQQRKLVEYLSEHGVCSLSTALYQFMPRSLRGLPLGPKIRLILSDHLRWLEENQELDFKTQHSILSPSMRPQQSELLLEKYKDSFSTLFSENNPLEELLEWVAIAQGELRVVLGRERALFAPYINLNELVLTDAEDVFYFHEQIPYLSLREVAKELAQIWNIPLKLKSNLENMAAKLLWGDGASGITLKASTTLIDLSKEIMVNEYLLKEIKISLAEQKTVILLYNAKDRLQKYQKDGIKGSRLIPGFESIQSELLKHLNLKEIPPNLIIGTRSILKSNYQNVGLTAILSLDPLLEAGNQADQLHGWADLGELLQYDAPCIIQAYNQDHPLITALRSHNLGNFQLEQIGEWRDLNLPPFGQRLTVLGEVAKIDKSVLEDLKNKIQTMIELPWVAGDFFEVKRGKNEYFAFLIENSNPSTNHFSRLPMKLRKYLISLPRPWKILVGPENIF